MAQNPPTGVVCSAGVVEACCCLVSLIQLPVTAIGTLKDHEDLGPDSSDSSDSD